ncbi:MAG: ABC transporter substrate-binding protein [Alphaproteobacteria bacterium]
MPAAAQKSQDTLRLVWRNPIPNVDQYYNNQREGILFARMVWDNLVERDPVSFEIKPALATAWKWVDAKTIDFDIRQGVRFHDGSELTAEDVAHTLNTVSRPEARIFYPRNTSWIDKVDVVDRYKVRINATGPFPAALEFLAIPLVIYPKAYYERVGAEGMGRAPIGTGPYRVTKLEERRQYELKRFDDHYKDSPKGRARIGTVTVRFVPDSATELAELLGGQADWIWYVAADQASRIERMPNLRTVRAETMRYGYLVLDAAGRSQPGNPLTHEKVRQAIIHAIDRESYTRNLVQGNARVLHAPCFPSQFGCDDSLATRYPYDPAKAKRLLAEAGYPNGFKTELVGWRSREWSEAIQYYLSQVGIDARVTMMQSAAAYDRFQKGELQIYQGDWGSFSLNDASSSLSVWFKGNKDDYARDPDVVAWLDAADTSIDPKVRLENYRKAIERITAKAYWAPLNSYVTNYAFTADLDFAAYADEIPRFYLASWK